MRTDPGERVPLLDWDDLDRSQPLTVEKVGQDILIGDFAPLRTEAFADHLHAPVPRGQGGGFLGLTEPRALGLYRKLGRVLGIDEEKT